MILILHYLGRKAVCVFSFPVFASLKYWLGLILTLKVSCYKPAGRQIRAFFSCGSSIFPPRICCVLLKLLYHCLLTLKKADMQELYFLIIKDFWTVILNTKDKYSGHGSHLKKRSDTLEGKQKISCYLRGHQTSCISYEMRVTVCGCSISLSFRGNCEKVSMMIAWWWLVRWGSGETSSFLSFQLSTCRVQRP